MNTIYSVLTDILVPVNNSEIFIHCYLHKNKPLNLVYYPDLKAFLKYIYYFIRNFNLLFSSKSNNAVLFSVTFPSIINLPKSVST